MDRQLREVFRQEFRRAMEGLNERYVTAETLCEHVETLTPQWLKHNGSCFNRTKVRWQDTNGVWHEKSPWLYPLHEIMAMVQDGRIKELVVKPIPCGETARHTEGE